MNPPTPGLASPPGRSLRWRLLAATLAGVGLALALAGAGLQSMFRDHVLRQYQTGLEEHLHELAGRLGFDAQGQPRLESMPMADTRWQRPLSGQYWQLDGLTPDGRALPGVLRSRSLWDGVLQAPADTLSAGQLHVHEIEGPQGTRLLLVERVIRPTEAEGTAWRLMVAGDLAATRAAVDDLARALHLSLAVLGVLLALAAWAQVSVGLRPLRQLQVDLGKVQAGRAEALAGRYPAEVQPLASDFNAVLRSQAALVERARSGAGNLAHALKTPLAVLDQLAQSTNPPGEWTSVVASQVAAARRQVDWHLARARLAGAAVRRSSRCTPEPVVRGLARVMARVHAARDLHIAIDMPPGLPEVACEAQDLHDILGNLMDNACKWARSTVHITATVPARSSSENLPVWVDVSVDDDGPGIPEDRRAAALARGGRLDESVPGSGLGLAIVVDAAHLHGGSLDLATSPLGGLRATVRLPAA